MIGHPDTKILIDSMKKLKGYGLPGQPLMAADRLELSGIPPSKEEKNNGRHCDITFVNHTYDSRKTGIDNFVHLPSAYRVYIGPDLFCFTCRQLKSQPHGHFAVQLAFNFESPFQLRIDESEQTDLFFFIIPAHVPHQLVSTAGKHLSILMDPLSASGQKLTALVKDEKAFMAFNQAVLDEIHPYLYAQLIGFETVDFPNAAVARLDALLSGFPECRMDERIQKVIVQCRTKKGIPPEPSDISQWTSLSQSRARHLFKEETGASFTQYLKWRKVMAAVEYACTNDSSLTDAAHMAGFSDSAHLSRTFKEMFGLSPSSVLQ